MNDGFRWNDDKSACILIKYYKIDAINCNETALFNLHKTRIILISICSFLTVNKT